MSNTVTHNTEKQRYEVHVDGAFAGFTQAIEDGDVVDFPHTKVFDEFGGMGLASILVSGALDDVRARGKKITVECSYILRFLEKHAEYADLLV